MIQCTAGIISAAMSSGLYDVHHRILYTMCQVSSTHRALENADIETERKRGNVKVMKHQS